MTRISIALVSTALLLVNAAQAADWVEGKHYSVLPQPQRTNVAPGKIEVMEVFSYGCPACNQFRPSMKKLVSKMPANVQVVYLPASWNAAENWPTFQRAYLTAQSLGVAEKGHDAMFDAIWTTGELSVTEAGGQRLKKNLPTIDDIAQLYQRVTGVKAADFVAASNSFGVNLKARQADEQISVMKVPSTPTLVVNGKYRVNNDNLNSADDVIEVVKFLVARESAAAGPPAKKS